MEAALLGALIGGALTIASSWLIQYLQSKQARRAEWRSYLLMLMNRLLDARQEYEQFLGSLGRIIPVSLSDTTASINAKAERDERLAGIVGKAIAACLATADPVLTRIANDELTPYPVRQGEDASNKDWTSRNRDAMQAAVSGLAELIRKA